MKRRHEDDEGPTLISISNDSCESGDDYDATVVVNELEGSTLVLDPEQPIRCRLATIFRPSGDATQVLYIWTRDRALDWDCAPTGLLLLVETDDDYKPEEDMAEDASRSKEGDCETSY